MSQRNLFVTTALPYANGAFHMGHIMEYIQADIWVRHERMSGNKVHFVGADDVHGAPIMIAAQKRGITPQAFVAEIAAGRKQYLDGFHISFDNWHSTDAVENHELSQDIYRRLVAAGLIYTKEIEQYYDTVKGMFLADRFIKGTCPRCGATDQYGDNCEKCSAVYSPMEVVNPYSTLSGSRPEIRKSTHYFFKLSDPQCVQFLRDWTNGKGKDGLPRVQQEVLAKDSEWLGKDGNLSDWDISRDEPYFGIAIPDAPGKYFYVWLDAPVGYLASLKNYCDKQGLDFEGILSDEKTEQIHFIGKDIIYFHTLFWPAMLHFAGKPFRVPDHVNAHGFMTVNGEKMSKSRGNVVNPDDIVRDYGADTMRLYEMFIGDFEKSAPWNTASIKGCRRFLERVWSLADILVDGDGYSAELEGAMHRTIKKVTEDIEVLKMNTAIAAMMSLLNEIYDKKSITRGEFKTLLILLNPFAPHITEELWQQCGYEGQLAHAKWPEFDEAKCVEDTVEIAVQVNGKLRAKLTVATGAAKEDAIAAAKAEPNVAKALEGKTICKEIYVPGKLVNIAVR